MGIATVLVVDDERKIRDTVRMFLERERYAVLLSGSGQEALDIAARLHPDLVVLDLMLPDLPGEEVARSLRAVSTVPITMLTAKADEAERVAGLRLGADDYGQAVQPIGAGGQGRRSAAPRAPRQDHRGALVRQWRLGHRPGGQVVGRCRDCSRIAIGGVFALGIGGWGGVWRWMQGVVPVVSAGLSAASGKFDWGGWKSCGRMRTCGSWCGCLAADGGGWIGQRRLWAW